MNGEQLPAVNTWFKLRNNITNMHNGYRLQLKWTSKILSSKDLFKNWHRLIPSQLEAALRIRDILVRIEVRGSAHLINGSGSCYFRQRLSRW